MVRIFDLITPSDLREKLRRDLSKMEAAPKSVDDAFNFFVTAWHLLDWQYPGRGANSAIRRNVLETVPLLNVCATIANSSKHRVIDDNLLTSVTDTRVSGAHFGPRNFSAGYFSRDRFGVSPLKIELQGDAAVEFGPTIDAIVLARKVMAYWDSQELED